MSDILLMNSTPLFWASGFVKGVLSFLIVMSHYVLKTILGDVQLLTNNEYSCLMLKTLCIYKILLGSRLF